MRFTLLALLALTLITWHQALALLYTPIETAEVERDITTPYNSTGLQIVNASLGTSSSGAWTSLPIRMRLLFDLPIAIANDMKIMNTRLAVRFYIYFVTNGPTFRFDYDIIPDGEQTRFEMKMCISDYSLVPVRGRTDGNNWIQYQLELLVYWMNPISNKIITVAWNAAYQFGQNDPDLTFYMSMVRNPRGWEQSGPKPASGCPKMAVGNGVKVQPTSWSFLPWIPIISNVGS